MIKDYDVLFSMATMNALTYSYISKFIRQVRIPHVILDIATPRFIGKSVSRRNFMKYILSNVDRVISLMSATTAFWSEHMGFHNKAIFIPQSVNPDLFVPNFQSKGNYIITVGRAGRDYATLFSVIKNLDVKSLVVIGSDLMQTKYEKILLRFKLNPIPNVRIVREVPYRVYKALIADSKFVVLPLLDIPYGSSGTTVLLESMAMGKAVITTRVHHTIDYVEDWKTGVFVEPNNPKDLSEKIIYLSESDSEVKRIGMNARRAIEEKFNERKMALSIEDVLVDASHDDKGPG